MRRIRGQGEANTALDVTSWEEISAFRALETVDEYVPGVVDHLPDSRFFSLLSAIRRAIETTYKAAKKDAAGEDRA